jgi:GNAT superfamily N-acetyltransferase
MPVIADAVYAREELPRDLEVQVLAFLRMEYPGGFRGDDRFRDRLWEGTTHFVRAAGDVLVSHAMVIPIELERAGRLLRIGGVASVLTYPHFRGEGHGEAVMRAAGRHIRERRFDVGMLFCGPEIERFYARLGWTTLEPGRVVVAGPQLADFVMILGDASRLPGVISLDWSW